jgi:uncharacterized protein YraI
MLYTGSGITHRRARVMSVVLVIMIALSLIATALLSAPRAAEAAQATTTTDLNLRSGASFGDGVITVMPQGAQVSVTGEAQNGFFPVVYNGKSGWAFGTYLSIGAGTTGSATTTTDLNLRVGPSYSDRVILVMPQGATVTLTGNSQNGFVSVAYQGRDGWAHSSYLSDGGGSSSEAAPAASAAPSDTARTTSALNLRSGPGTGNSVILVMPSGATVSVTGGAQNGFYPVTYNGRSGWASGAYLSMGGSGGGTTNAAPAPSAGSSSGSIVDIIYAAADRYGQSRAEMLRVAKCESNLDPKAVNPSGSYGLFQFTRGTWATTPYASYDIFDAWASANAAGWMWSVGRRGEWVC